MDLLATSIEDASSDASPSTWIFWGGTTMVGLLPRSTLLALCELKRRIFMAALDRRRWTEEPVVVRSRFKPVSVAEGDMVKVVDYTGRSKDNRTTSKRVEKEWVP